VQALWRSSEWITAIAAGLLYAHSLPRLAAATGCRRDCGANCAVAARHGCWRRHWLALCRALAACCRRSLALLYRADLPVTRLDALPFFAGDALRMLSWILSLRPSSRAAPAAPW
jgi:hypothetical protein